MTARPRLTPPESCAGCGACAAACPEGVLRMSPDAEGFLRPVPAADGCTGCRRCETVCPELHPPFRSVPGKVFRAFHVREERRELAASGGVFGALADSVLRQRGVVFGAAFDAELRVKHICAAAPEELTRLFNSKYVQSDKGNAFQEIRDHLRREHPVLFAGTPCEVAGLLSFLGDSRKNLLTVDLVCNGVPSPAVWNGYLNYLEAAYGWRPEFFNFRDKRARDGGHTVVWKAGGVEHVAPKWQDPYCKFYVAGMISRSSCTRCKYAAFERVSDLTLGDFWNDPEVRFGRSLVLVNTAKGEELLRSCAGELEIAQSSPECASQPRLQSPPPAHRLRALTMKSGGDFAALLARFGKMAGIGDE